MKDSKLIWSGAVGSVIVALCCFTPGWIDYVLFPALALFLGITAYGLWRRRRAEACWVDGAETTTNESV